MPLTSIIVPTMPRLDLLTRCLTAVHANTADVDYELLVIDNGSRPRGFTWAANRGLRAAAGDVLVMLSDDVVVTDGWLAPLLTALEQGMWAASATNTDADGQILTENWTLNAHCCAFSRHGYEQLGGYSERYIHWLQDWELIDRLKAANAGYSRCEDSLVQHLPAPQPTDPDLLATMRAWHVHDYGYEPDSWRGS
jgi:GT2 family glycosyltransferase